MNIHSALAIAGILGPLIWVIGDLLAGFKTGNYSIMQDSISSLALTRIGWLQTIGFLALGLLVEIFAAGLLFNVKRKRWFNLGVGIFVIFGFALLLYRRFPYGRRRRPADFKWQNPRADGYHRFHHLPVSCPVPHAQYQEGR